ncbi:hypothetical protein [Phytohabitans houttuyneae]|uniref:DNA-binding protein n=1 Tax=Phytohabitans houttuyneae TaxID=1076126 RepID=A0A6V8K1L0_9ACTN|nr:hypothetical protein [Phytohabitans houttuyneae]GFJ77470.1 hypothetical protein Phou_016500 [Phytohabitans houttuyneae]
MNGIELDGNILMILHRFALILDRPADRRQARAVTAAHPDLHLRPHERDVAVARRASSLAAAVVSAIYDLEALDLFPVRVGAYDWVTLADIGDRIGRSRELVRLWSIGRQGPGGFPPPVNPGRDTRFYSWTEVTLWLRQSMGFGLARPDAVLVVANLLLQVRRLAPLVRDKQLLSSLLPAQPTR